MQFTFEELDISGKNADKFARGIFIEIANGNYSEGSQLPSVREMAKESSMTDYSARKVMMSLADAGLVEVKSRKGIYVAAGAKQKAVDILKRYNQSFSGIKDDSEQRTIAIAAAFKNTIDGPQIYHPQTISGIYREAQKFNFNVELINFNVNISEPAILLNVVRANGYDGVVWLYPDVSHWDSINSLRDSGIPVALSSHWLFNTSLPCVQISGYSSTLSIVKHLVEVEKCDVINWFSTEVYDKAKDYDNDYAKVSASGVYQTLKLVMNIVGEEKCKLNIIDYDGCRVSTERMLKNIIAEDNVKNGIVIANTEELSDFFKRHPESFDDIDRHCLLVGSTYNQFPRLEPIVERIGDIYISLLPFEDVGRALTTKINALLEGRFVDNTTLINPSFGLYSELLETSKELSHKVDAESDLLLTV
ncbi:MAG: GntR family transcriptional regulator [Sedimentisphaeraceae bacterium JB056]